MKSVTLNSLTITKDGAPFELMGVTDNKKWELIADITVTEETMLVVCDKDVNGNSFSLNGMYVEIKAKPASASSFIKAFVNENSNFKYYAGEMASALYTSARESAIWGIKIGESLFDFSWAVATNGTTQSGKTTFSKMRVIDVINSLYLNTTAPFPVGTTIKIYGIKA